MDWKILEAMIGVGLVAGFVGGGGSGLALSILTSFFHIPIHQAIGTSLASNVITTFWGALSHLREGNVRRSLGVIIGLFGLVGAYLGGGLAAAIGSGQLKVLCGVIILLSVSLIFFQTRIVCPSSPSPERVGGQKGAIVALVGLFSGGMSGLFGVSGTAFFQVGLIGLLKTPLVTAVGTSMLSLFLVSFSGAYAYWQRGMVDSSLLFNIVVGTSLGAYVGAKLTRRVPSILLRVSVVLVGGMASVMLIFF